MLTDEFSLQKRTGCHVNKMCLMYVLYTVSTKMYHKGIKVLVIMIKICFFTMKVSFTSYLFRSYMHLNISCLTVHHIIAYSDLKHVSKHFVRNER